MTHFPFSFAFQIAFGQARKFGMVIITVGITVWPLRAALAGTSVWTYHYDDLRTGWNPAETILTPAAVANSGFGLLATIGLDEQVDAQPLVVPGVVTASQGTHDIVYVVTENDTVYAIDAESGAVLVQRSLGAPVPMTTIPPKGKCNKNSGVIGITSTPVIDIASGLLYVMSYTEESGMPVYRLHALDIATLADSVPPVVVAASQTLADGSSYQFQAAYSRQRPALLLSNGTIYAGFGSFCDGNHMVSRGWVLGWSAGTLAPLAGNVLVDRLASEPGKYFLSSVWMSGYGLAADHGGSVYFATGNTTYAGAGYNSQFNPSESVLKVSADLTTVEDFFTPGGVVYGATQLDIKDLDFGSGGVLLLPPQAGSVANMAIAAGKIGMMYLLNQDMLGGYNANGPDDDLGNTLIGPCYCGQSYFTGDDGLGRVVSSGGRRVIVWRLQTSPAIALQKAAEAAPLEGGLNNGFFTSVSSNGTVAGSAVIWAVSRPVPAGSSTVSLLAYDGGNGSTLFSSVAGPWPNPGRENLVPVVANGFVYVASYKQLAIFGLGGGAAQAPGHRKPGAGQRPLP